MGGGLAAPIRQPRLTRRIQLAKGMKSPPDSGANDTMQQKNNFWSAEANG